MKKIIDNFSTQATTYAKYRPIYPLELYDYLLNLVDAKDNVWDCGTGNGHVANVLADHFKQVCATDISENQLKNAISKKNITYTLQRAESTNFRNNHFDLITVGQAIHWFDFDAFYQEVQRVAKPEALLAIFGYGLLSIEGINEDLVHFYKNIIGPYWNKERRYIDEHYETIPFPFGEIPSKKTFTIKDNWQLTDLEGYLNSWSSVQRFIKKEGFNPVTPFIDGMNNKWEKTERKVVRFPVLLRVGVVVK